MARSIQSQILDQMQKMPPSPSQMERGESHSSKKQKMLVVHMRNDELEALDNMQGGPSIDPELGIREYSAIGPMLDNPEVVEVFKVVYQDLRMMVNFQNLFKKLIKKQKLYHSLIAKHLPNIQKSLRKWESWEREEILSLLIFLLI